LEEIARVYGYERIPETRLSDELPPQMGNPTLEHVEHVRDLLVDLGLQEVVTYRMTSPERESRLKPGGEGGDAEGYVRIANPITADRYVLRRSLLASVLEIVERNARLTDRIALFEIGPVFNASADGDLPEEAARLAVVMTGKRQAPAWQSGDSEAMDFYDLKGVLSELSAGLRLGALRFAPEEQPGFHPGKCARLWLGEHSLGVMGELHPLVVEHYEFPETALLAAELDLRAILSNIPVRYMVEPVPVYPPVLEDLALIVDEAVPAEQVEAALRKAGGEMLSGLRLFDVYRGEQIGAGKKSLAYSLTYQAQDRTLTDDEVLKIRQRIVKQLEQELGAKLRG
jgi:phenylalanyl-tRNA synthetase beta chain